MTFDEFLSIPPCTVGKHSTTDDTPKINPSPQPEVHEDIPPPPKPIATNRISQDTSISQIPQAAPIATPLSTTLESESDDPSTPIPSNVTCRRRGCNVASSAQIKSSRQGEVCIFHSGQALFHEGAKGWTCCKRRVLEFDEFMKITGCQTKNKHLFVGSKKDAAKEEAVVEVRYVQTPSIWSCTCKAAPKIYG